MLWNIWFFISNLGKKSFFLMGTFYVFIMGKTFYLRLSHHLLLIANKYSIFNYFWKLFLHSGNLHNFDAISLGDFNVLLYVAISTERVVLYVEFVWWFKYWFLFTPLVLSFNCTRVQLWFCKFSIIRAYMRLFSGDCSVSRYA